MPTRLGSTTVAVESISASAENMTANFRVHPAGVPEISVAINGGAASTSSANVVLTLAMVSGLAPTQMSFANDAGGTPGTWSDWEPWGTSKAWTIEEASGPSIVWARARNGYGIGTPAYDSIHFLETVTVAVTTPATQTRAFGGQLRPG